MFTVSVRDHVMIAHSFRGETFGPAQRLHGATYVVDVALSRETLDADGVVADIGRLTDVLREVLASVNYRNLDEVAAFAGRNTTTEVMAQWVFAQMAARLRTGALGAAATDVSEMVVTLRESHVAWASFRGDPRAGTA